MSLLDMLLAIPVPNPPPAPPPGLENFGNQIIAWLKWGVLIGGMIGMLICSGMEESTTPSEFWYKVTGGDPAGDLVLISIAIKTPQSTDGGGYIGSDHTMRWVAGDWQMQVPPPRASIIPSVSGFTLLGRPHV